MAARRRRVKMDDVDAIEPLSYDVQGEGLPLLLLHGLGAHRGTWDDLLPFLVPRYRVYRADLRGFGVSPKPDDDRYGLLDYVSGVRQLIADLDLRELTLVGHSLGGAISLVVARDEPDRVQRLVLLDAPAYPDDVPWLISLLMLPPFEWLFEHMPVAWLLPLSMRRIYRRWDVLTRERIDKYRRPLRTRETKHAIAATARRGATDPLEELAERHEDVHVPTLLIWGRDDRIVPLSKAERLSRVLPSRLVVIDRCGHVPHEEYPAETAEAILDFLDSTLGVVERNDERATRPE